MPLTEIELYKAGDDRFHLQPYYNILVTSDKRCAIQKQRK